MPKIFLDQRGMTLAEILIAIVIIGIGLTALASAIPLSNYGIQEGNQLSTATFLANQRMEQVRQAIWQLGTPPSPPDAAQLAPLCTVGGQDKLGVSASSTSAPANGGGTTFPDESPVAGYTAYTRTVRVFDVGNAASCNILPPGLPAPVYGLRQVTVTVSYRPMTGIGVGAATTTKSAVVTMYISQR